jgi:hypothetical protein
MGKSGSMKALSGSLVKRKDIFIVHRIVLLQVSFHSPK